MGHACSSDQSAPLNNRIPPCPRHRLSPQRDCRACQEFMSSRRPEPRGNQFPPRVQQRYPPQMRGQRPPQQPPMGRQPYLEGRSGRSTMNNQGAPHQIRGPSQQMIVGPSSQLMGRQSPQMMSRLMMESPLQGVLGSMPVAQPQIMKGSQMHIPQQVMPPRMINMEVPMPTVIQAPAPPPCTTDIIVPQTQYEEILPAQKVMYEQVMMPIPNVVTAPAPPPCTTDLLVQEVRTVPQQPQPRIPQQPANSRIPPQYQQPRFL